MTFIELFFDLVFVFAVTQLSHLLMEHFTLLGAAQSLLLLLAVWWVWIFTSWVTNWLDPEKLPVRFLLLAIMFVGLVMSSSIPKAFESRGIAFATAYVIIQIGRTAFFLWAVKDHPVMVRNFQRIIVWLGIGGMLWIAGGFASGPARLALWVLAVGFEYVSPSLGFWVPGLGRSKTSDWEVEGRHMAERCALFIIIALGESILVTGATFSSLEWTLPILAAFVVCFAGSIAMWWLYFDASAEVGSEAISRSSDPGRLARLSYTYIHLFIIAGIIISAVADEFVLAHPLGHTEEKTAIAVLGSTAFILGGHHAVPMDHCGQTPSLPCGGDSRSRAVGAREFLLAAADPRDARNAGPRHQWPFRTERLATCQPNLCSSAGENRIGPLRREFEVAVSTPPGSSALNMAARSSNSPPSLSEIDIAARLG